MKKYKIADLVVSMDPKFQPLLPQSEAYIYCGNEKSYCEILTPPEVVDSYRARFPDAEESLIEYMHTGAVFYTNLIHQGGMMLHASAVEMDGKAYLFSAPSGTGKSTHTSLWVKEFSPRAAILNDDKPAIRINSEEISVYGTPWSGKTNQNLNHKVPLQAIAFIKRGEKNEIHRISSISAIEKILSQTVRSSDKNTMERLLDILGQIVQRIPVYELSCNMDPEAAHIAYNTMSQGETL